LWRIADHRGMTQNKFDNRYAAIYRNDFFPNSALARGELRLAGNSSRATRPGDCAGQPAEWLFPSWRANRHLTATSLSNACRDASKQSGLTKRAAFSRRLACGDPYLMRFVLYTATGPTRTSARHALQVTFSRIGFELVRSFAGGGQSKTPKAPRRRLTGWKSRHLGGWPGRKGLIEPPGSCMVSFR